MTITQVVKRIFSIILIIVVTVSLAACSDDDTRRKSKDADVSSDTSAVDVAEDIGPAEDTRHGDVADSGENDSGQDVQEDAVVDLVPIGEPCPCQWGGMAGSATGCDGCMGGVCYQPTNLAYDPYCTKECDANGECEEYGDDWICDVYFCADESRESWF